MTASDRKVFVVLEEDCRIGGRLLWCIVACVEVELLLEKDMV